MAEKKEPKPAKVEKKEPVKTVKVDVDAWIKRKLKAIHEMQDEAKAKALAERIMRNRRDK